MGRQPQSPPLDGKRPAPQNALGPSLLIWPYAFAGERAVLAVAYFLFTEVSNIFLNTRCGPEVRLASIPLRFIGIRSTGFFFQGSAHPREGGGRYR